MVFSVLISLPNIQPLKFVTPLKVDLLKLASVKVVSLKSTSLSKTHFLKLIL